MSTITVSSLSNARISFLQLSSLSRGTRWLLQLYVWPNNRCKFCGLLNSSRNVNNVLFCLEHVCVSVCVCTCACVCVSVSVRACNDPHLYLSNEKPFPEKSQRFAVQSMTCHCSKGRQRHLGSVRRSSGTGRRRCPSHRSRRAMPSEPQRSNHCRSVDVRLGERRRDDERRAGGRIAVARRIHIELGRGRDRHQRDDLQAAAHNRPFGRP